MDTCISIQSCVCCKVCAVYYIYRWKMILKMLQQILRIACFQNGLNEPTYFLIIERNIVTDTKTFITLNMAVVVWFLSHYIYNIGKLKRWQLFFKNSFSHFPLKRRRVLIIYQQQQESKVSSHKPDRILFFWY